MNKAAWDKLSDQNKAIIEIALGESTMHTYVESDHAQFAAMAEYQEKHGVKVKRWSDEDLAAFEKAWLEVLAEELAKDPLFKKVADHYLDYRKKFVGVGHVADDEAHLRRQVSSQAGAAVPAAPATPRSATDVEQSALQARCAAVAGTRRDVGRWAHVGGTLSA